MDELEPANILLVDDRAEGLLTLETVLKRPDYNLISVQSGTEALAQLLKNDFAVILLDVQMPDMDGFETAAFIKQREKSKNIPIIFVTAINKDDRYVTYGYDSGAVDYVFKPFDPHILTSKVAVFVELFRKTQQVKHQADLLWKAQQQEQVRHLAQLELENLNRYRNLADAIPHIVWKAKADGTVDYFNQTWIKYSGLSKDQSSGEGWCAAFHPSDLTSLKAEWSKAMQTKEGFELECRIRCAEDNSFRWHLLRAVPEKNPEGILLSWLLTSTEIHLRKEAEGKLIEAKEVADAANRAKSFFLANMSHEIRTPLAAIMGFSDLMADTSQNSQDREQYASTIKRNGEQLLRIIDELLDISKIEADRLTLEKMEMNLIDAIMEVKACFCLQVEKKGLDLNFILDAPIPATICSDPTRVRQVLINIIGNAVKFSFGGQGAVDVNIGFIPASKDHTAQVYFSIRDQGPGIDKEHVDALFQPFSQGDSSTTRKFGGTGLGLALSRKLARALGGDVILTETQPGAGSTFRVSFDVGTVGEKVMVDKLENEGTSTGFSEPVELVSVSQNLDGLHILLAEDGVDNQRLMSRILGLAGARVDLACNGSEAVTKAMTGEHSLVLMDIQMPELDGYEATSTLRQNGFARPIIALTAHALPEERERCLQAGCDDHLPKPVNRQVLVECISHHVNMTSRAKA